MVKRVPHLIFGCFIKVATEALSHSPEEFLKDPEKILKRKTYLNVRFRAEILQN